MIDGIVIIKHFNLVQNKSPNKQTSTKWSQFLLTTGKWKSLGTNNALQLTKDNF